MEGINYFTGTPQQPQQQQPQQYEPSISWNSGATAGNSSPAHSLAQSTTPWQEQPAPHQYATAPGPERTTNHTGQTRVQGQRLPETVPQQKQKKEKKPKDKPAPLTLPASLYTSGKKVKQQNSGPESSQQYHVYPPPTRAQTSVPGAQQNASQMDQRKNHRPVTYFSTLPNQNTNGNFQQQTTMTQTQQNPYSNGSGVPIQQVSPQQANGYGNQMQPQQPGNAHLRPNIQQTPYRNNPSPQAHTSPVANTQQSQMYANTLEAGPTKKPPFRSKEKPGPYYVHYSEEDLDWVSRRVFFDFNAMKKRKFWITKRKAGE